jgi:hypothetical protein
MACISGMDIACIEGMRANTREYIQGIDACQSKISTLINTSNKGFLTLINSTVGNLPSLILQELAGGMPGLTSNKGYIQDIRRDKTMKELKHDSQYNEAIDRAEADFRRPDGKLMKDKCPYIFTSNMADAYWITANCLYWNGRRPLRLHKSRGNRWLVNAIGETVAAEVLRPDHREGIKYTPYTRY